jgi:hypothetical protein
MVCLLAGILVSFLTTSAKTEYPYYIKVNKQQNVVTVYKKDKKGEYTVPYKAFTCSTGVDTPLGVYKTPAKYRWRLLMGDVWGQYSTRIVRGILFHSVWYYQMDATTLSAVQYNKLGTAASHGCVRLTVADAKWIYDNCPLGTTVEIYNSKDPGPLGKPETMKLLPGTGWDPTDPSKDNPFNSKAPSISGASNKTIEWGTQVNLLSGVKALSTAGTDITGKIKTEGTVDVYTAGKYSVKYTVIDLLGRSAEKTITVTVKDMKEPPVIKGVSDRVIDTDTVVDRAFALKGVTAYLSTKKLSNKDIKVAIKKESDTVYTITYTLTAQNKKKAKEVATVNVDTTAPVMTGIQFKSLTKKQWEAGKEAITTLARKGVKVTDDYSKLAAKDIKVSLKANGDYAYIVTYKASDQVGNTISETVQFTYFPDIKIEGIYHHTNIPYHTEITEEYVMQGIMAVNSNNEECTDLVKVTIKQIDERLYKVTYQLPAPDDSVISVSCNFSLAEKTEEESGENITQENTEELDSSQEPEDSSKTE